MKDRGGALMRVHTCVMCRKPFYSSRRHAKFDCVRCRVAYHRWEHSNTPEYIEDKNEQNSRLQQLIFGGEFQDAR